jgi:hypothetical protein
MLFLHILTALFKTSSLFAASRIKVDREDTFKSVGGSFAAKKLQSGTLSLSSIAIWVVTHTQIRISLKPHVTERF